MAYLNDPGGTRLPIKLDTTTNGEFAPIPLEPVHHEARRRGLEAAGENAKRLALDRRSFLISACGAATALLGMNEAYARRGLTGGYFDVQGHFVNPTGAWTKRLPPNVKPLPMPKTVNCGPAKGPGQLDYLQCIGPDEFVRMSSWTPTPT
jgi:hypothetical protein